MGCDDYKEPAGMSGLRNTWVQEEGGPGEPGQDPPLRPFGLHFSHHSLLPSLHSSLERPVVGLADLELPCCHVFH